MELFATCLDRVVDFQLKPLCLPQTLWHIRTVAQSTPKIHITPLIANTKLQVRASEVNKTDTRVHKTQAWLGCWKWIEDQIRYETDQTTFWIHREIGRGRFSGFFLFWHFRLIFIGSIFKKSRFVDLMLASRDLAKGEIEEWKNHSNICKRPSSYRNIHMLRRFS